MPKNEIKKLERKPRKTAQTTHRRAKLAPLQKLEQERERLLDRCARLAKANREKAEHICAQRVQIEQWKNNCEGYKKIAIERQKTIDSNGLTIASIEKDAISKIKALKAALFLSLSTTIICIIILLYLINY